MAKYLSRRVPTTSQSKLPADRYQYLKIADAEPNLGQPPGNQNVPVGPQYFPISIPGYSERYWIPVPPAVFSQGITVRDEGNIVGVANSITQLNFVGRGVVATAEVSNGLGIATITVLDIPVLSPSDDQIRYIGFTSSSSGGVLDKFEISPTTLVFNPSSR